MSSAVVSTSAALGRPFAFDEEEVADVSLPFAPATVHPSIRLPQTGRHAKFSGDPASVDPRLASVTPASRLEIRPAPEMVSCGVSAIDALTGGLPRGCLTEICGLASSGRTSLLLATLAAATRRGEFCVVVDASDSLDPHSAAAAGVELDRLLWVRCGESCSPRNRPFSRVLAQACRSWTNRTKLRISNRIKYAPNMSQNIVSSKSCVPPICCSKAEASASSSLISVTCRRNQLAISR